MFVRIVTDGVHDSVYQCDRVQIHPVEGKPSEFTITMERDGTHTAVSATIDKSTPKAVGAYLMNDRGQTIDTIFRKESN